MPVDPALNPSAGRGYPGHGIYGVVYPGRGIEMAYTEPDTSPFPLPCPESGQGYFPLWAFTIPGSTRTHTSFLLERIKDSYEWGTALEDD